MFSKLWGKIKSVGGYGYLIGFMIVMSVYMAVMNSGILNGPLPESKGGIQNHLVWNIKGECYFVRPANHTVYLIRVEDCDKGNK